MADTVKITAEPVPCGRDEYQLFLNAIVTHRSGKKLYIPQIYVDTGMDKYYETSELEGLYGHFPVTFNAEVESGIDWDYCDDIYHYNVFMTYAGEDFFDVEPLSADDDTAYFREWNTWLMDDRCRYYPVLEA